MIFEKDFQNKNFKRKILELRKKYPNKSKYWIAEQIGCSYTTARYWLSDSFRKQHKEKVKELILDKRDEGISWRQKNRKRYNELQRKWFKQRQTQKDSQAGG